MDVTPNTRTVTEYHLTLSSDEALQCIAEPWPFGEALAEKLRAAGLGHTPASNGHRNGSDHTFKPAGAHKRTGKRAAKKRAAKKAAAKKAAPNGGKSLYQCPNCERTFKHQGRLNNHLRDAHSQTAASSTATSAAAPTWQKEPAAAAD